MHKILEKIKKAIAGVVPWLKANKGAAILILIICACLPKIYDFYLAPEKAKETKVYKAVEADKLFSLKGEQLKNVKNFYVVTPSSFKTRDVLVRTGKDNKIEIYKNVPLEAFEAYTSTVLSDYLKKNGNIDFRYVPNYKEASTRLGLKEEITLDKPKQEGRYDAALNALFQIIIFGLLFYFVIRMSGGGGLTNKIETIMPNQLKDDLDDLVGLEDIKAELLQLEDMYLNKEQYKRYNLTENFNVMMTGGAGLGKTKMARCLAKRLNIPMIYTSAAGLQSGYVGGGARALKNLVKQASKHKRAIIFIDEGETLLMSRTEGMQQWQVETTNALLSLIDGVQTKKSDIIWIIASNMDETKISMDAATLRRFHLKVNFRMPNFNERKSLIDHLISKFDKDIVGDDINTNALAGITSGISNANLVNIVNRAGLIAIKEDSKVTQKILLMAFERNSVGLTDRATTENQEAQRLLVARHEAGHFIMKLHYALKQAKWDINKAKDHIDVIKISTESVSKINALGFVLSKEKEVKLETLNEYEEMIMQLYGGMVNEEIFYGASGVTAGAHNDISKVSQLLKVMVCEVGFYQKSKLNYSVINGGGAISAEQTKLIAESSEQLYVKTREVLQGYQELSTLISDHLMKDYQLEISEAMVLVEQFFANHPERMEEQMLLENPKESLVA